MSEGQAQAGDRVILVVEDEMTVANAIAVTLGREGLHTLVVHSGTQALMLAHEQQPDLVIVDVTLGDLSGIEVCAAMKADAVTAGIPLILISDEQSKGSRLMGSAAGADKSLSKPFSPTELIALVNELLSGVSMSDVPPPLSQSTHHQDQLAVYAEELKELFERERIERQALDDARRRLNEVERLKSAFLGVVTHELMTPFASIGLALQVLQQVSDGFRPDQVAALENLATEIGDLHRLVNGVVKFAELVNKQRQPQPGYYDLAEVLPAAVQPVAVLAQARHVDFRVFVPPDLPKVYADPELVGEAAFQMAHNAIKFNEPSGSAELRAYESIGWVVIEVNDSGVGLSEERLSLLGQPFEQSADALRRGKEGLGIGWTFVCYVAEVHDGWTRVKSPGPGEGSSFCLALPTDPPEGVLVREPE